jgi:hypothetical protein
MLKPITNRIAAAPGLQRHGAMARAVTDWRSRVEASRVCPLKGIFDGAGTRRFRLARRSGRRRADDRRECRRIDGLSSGR